MLLCRNLLELAQGPGDPQPARRHRHGGKPRASTSFGCGLRSSSWPGCSRACPAGSTRTCNAYVSPAPFDLRPGIELLLMALVGGAGHIAGAVVGAAIITLLKNVLQDVLPHLHALQRAARNRRVRHPLYRPAAEGARGHRADDQPLSAARRAASAGAGVAARTPGTRPPSPAEPVLTIQGATKRFGALAAVNDVSFEVKPGEVLGLIGPNGAGKTTLLNLITGTAKPNAGRILFLDDDITKLAPRHIAANGIVRTFQHVKLRPNMTLLDNVLLGTYSRTRSGFFAGALSGSTAAKKRLRKARSLGAIEAHRPRRKGRRARPAICRSASSACWRSRARSPPIRSW